MFALYTPQTANKALPEVKRLFENIVMQKNQVVSLQEELQAIIDSGSTPLQVLSRKSKSSMVPLPNSIQQ